MQGKPKKSVLRGSESYVAQVLPIPIGDDVYTFDLRELSAKAQIEIEEWRAEAAADLGIDVETITDAVEFGKWLAANATRKHEASGLSVKMHFTQLLEAQWDIALKDALNGWNLNEPFTEENILRLPRTIKQPLFKALDAGASFGVGAEQFFR